MINMNGERTCRGEPDREKAKHKGLLRNREKLFCPQFCLVKIN